MIMDIVVQKDEFLRGLNHVQSIVERRNTVPILANIKLEADDNRLSLTATDMDISVNDIITVQCNQPGSITLPAVTLYEIVRKVSENCEVSIIANPDTSSATIVVGTSDFNLPTLPVDSFPQLDQDKPTHSFKVPSEHLKALFLKTRHAISNEETRYYLCGSYFHVINSEAGVPVLRVVATDAHRLARAEVDAPSGCEGMPGIIVPRKTVNEIVRLLEDYSGDVEVAISDRRVTFNIGTTVLSSRIIEGKFPDYDRVIPANNDKTLEVAREALAKSIDLVISISTDKTKSVKLNVESSKIVITASSDLNGNARGAQEIPANFNSDEQLSISFNSRYLLDSLAAIDSDTVTLTLSNATGPMLAKDNNYSNFLYLLMPLQA